MTDAADVRVRLVVDSNSEKIAADMKRDLHRVEGAAKHAGNQTAASLSGGFKAGAVALGNIYAEVARMALHYGKEALMAPIEAFIGGEKVVRGFAGAFATVDTAGNSMERLQGLAGEVKGELTTMAMAAGVAENQLFDAFEGIISRGGKSVEEAQKLTEAIAFAGKAVPGGAGALGAAFEQVQMGMIRATNPIAGMVAATGRLKGSAREVALEMQKMSAPERMKIAEEAVARMGEKMRKLPLTFSEGLQSLKTLSDDIFEEAGKAMAPGITKTVDKIRAVFLNADGTTTELTDKLYRTAAQVGEFLSQAFDAGRQFVDGFASGMSIANEEFRLIWHEVLGDSDQTWKNMLEYTKMAGSVLGGFVKFFATGIGAMIVVIQKTVKYIVEAVGLAAEIAGKLTGSEGMTSFGKKAQQLAFSSEQEDKLAKLRRSSTGSVEAEELRKSYIATAGFTGQEDYLTKLEEAESARKEVEAQVNAARVNATVEHAKEYYEAFAKAAELHDEAAMKNIASFMGNNAAMAEAIGKLGPEVLGSAKDDFLRALQDVGAADAATALKKAARPDLKVSKASVVQNFNGPMTVKQDFKEADPDRIIVAFKEKLAAVGSNRLQARTANPFGF